MKGEICSGEGNDSILRVTVVCTSACFFLCKWFHVLVQRTGRDGEYRVCHEFVNVTRMFVNHVPLLSLPAQLSVNDAAERRRQPAGVGAVRNTWTSALGSQWGVNNISFKRIECVNPISVDASAHGITSLQREHAANMEHFRMEVYDFVAARVPASVKPR